MITTVYRSFIFIACIVLLIMLTIQLWYTVDVTAVKLKAGATSDSGIYPKRSRNVNAYYIASPNTPDGLLSISAYPPVFNGTYNPGKPSRIVIPPTTSCPVFRAQDNGSTDPPVIG